MAQTKPPVHQIRLGPVRAAIWANETETGVRHSVTLERLYKDAEGHWKHTDSLAGSELLTAAKVLDMAHSWICLEAKGAEGQSAPAPTD
jgi:hypothetical protein